MPPTVSATAEPRSSGPACCRLPRARGRAGIAARVATSAAIAFEASWIPFVKANARAAKTATTRPASIPPRYVPAAGLDAVSSRTSDVADHRWPARRPGVRSGHVPHDHRRV